MSAPLRTREASSVQRTARSDRTSGGVPEPLAGVRSLLVTAVTRRVARRLRDATPDVGEPDVVAALLAAIALVMDGRHPDFVATLLRRSPPRVGQQLVEMLRTELLESWAQGRSSASGSVILDALTGLEQVRRALSQRSAEPLREGLTGPDALHLLVDVAHDLRSPLTSILFLAETLQRGRSGEVNKLQQRQLGLIYSAALGLSGTVDDALELARNGDASADSEPSPLSLSELLDSVADIVRAMAEEKGIRIDLTPGEPDHRLGHPVALSRVLLNLTTNALKFTEQGSVTIACAAQGPTRVEFSVRDTGPGINSAALVNLYHPFRRARRRRGYRFSGTGLGLAISRKLVVAMGSELQLETGCWGTRFHFELDLPVLPRL